MLAPLRLIAGQGAPANERANNHRHAAGPKLRSSLFLMEQPADLGPQSRGHARFSRAIRTPRSRPAAEDERFGAKALNPWHLGCGLLQVGKGDSMPPGLPTGWVGVRSAAPRHSTRGVGCHPRCIWLVYGYDLPWGAVPMGDVPWMRDTPTVYGRQRVGTALRSGSARNDQCSES